jgi:hypothetical protein
VISHTVPSSSTRPNRRGLLAGGPMTGWAVSLGDGRGPGRGPGRGTAGLVSLLCESSAVMGNRHLTLRAVSPAHLPRIAAPSARSAENCICGPALPASAGPHRSRQSFKQLGGSRAAALALPAKTVGWFRPRHASRRAAGQLNLAVSD